MGSTAPNVEAARVIAAAFLTWACDDERGDRTRGTSDPVYRLVDSDAKARARGLSLYEISRLEHWPHPHSSCALLGHDLLEVLGVQSPWCGREPQHVNIFSRLAYCPASRPPKTSDVYLAGDVHWIGDTPGTSHVECVLEHDPGKGRVVVAEYGQPGGAIHEKQISSRWGHVYVGQRPLERVIPLGDVLQAAHDAGELGVVVLPVGMPDVDVSSVSDLELPFAVLGANP